MGEKATAFGTTHFLTYPLNVTTQHPEFSFASIFIEGNSHPTKNVQVMFG